MAQTRKNPLEEIRRMIELGLPAITIKWDELKAWQILVDDTFKDAGYKHDPTQDKEGRRTYRRTDR